MNMLIDSRQIMTPLGSKVVQIPDSDQIMKSVTVTPLADDVANFKHNENGVQFIDSKAP